jgi:hypothetical protein
LSGLTTDLFVALFVKLRGLNGLRKNAGFEKKAALSG